MLAEEYKLIVLFVYQLSSGLKNHGRSAQLVPPAGAESPESYRQPVGESDRTKPQLNSFMKQRSTIFLQVVIVLIGILALAIMIRFPLTEGRAKIGRAHV